MDKSFNAHEERAKNVDQSLADSINDLVTEGIVKERYSELTNDSNNRRSENCTSLVFVKLNQWIWDAVPQSARTRDTQMKYI